MNLLNKLISLSNKHKIKWNKITILVVRIININNEYIFGMSKPCCDCVNRLKRTSFKYIIWSNQNNNFDVCKLCDLNSDHISSANRI